MENYVNLMFSLFLLNVAFIFTLCRPPVCSYYNTFNNRDGFQAAVLFLLSKVKQKYFKIKFTILLIS